MHGVGVAVLAPLCREIDLVANDLAPRQGADLIFTTAGQDQQLDDATEVVIVGKVLPDGGDLLLAQHAVTLAAIRHRSLQRVDHGVVVAQAHADGIGEQRRQVRANAQRRRRARSSSSRPPEPQRHPSA